MADNRFNFYKFRMAAYDRAFILERIAKKSVSIFEDINDQLGPDKTGATERNLFYKYLDEGTKPSRIKRIFSKYFSSYDMNDFEQLGSKKVSQSSE